MAKPNYGYEKRQKELAKKKKKEEKLKSKGERKAGDGQDDSTPNDAANEAIGEAPAPETPENAA